MWSSKMLKKSGQWGRPPGLQQTHPTARPGGPPHKRPTITWSRLRCHVLLHRRILVVGADSSVAIVMKNGTRIRAERLPSRDRKGAVAANIQFSTPRPIFNRPGAVNPSAFWSRLRCRTILVGQTPWSAAAPSVGSSAVPKCPNSPTRGSGADQGVRPTTTLVAAPLPRRATCQPAADCQLASGGRPNCRGGLPAAPLLCGVGPSARAPRP